MNILWLCNMMLPKISKNLSKSINNGGGWLVGLSDDLLQQDSINLTISFPVMDGVNIIEGEIDGLLYFGFPQAKKDYLRYNSNVEKHLENIIKKTKPDVIHIFGTEYAHTLAMVNACEKLNILEKVIINIQGLVSICEKHYYANLPISAIYNYTIRDFIKNDNINKQKEKFRICGKYEVEALNKVSNVIGRTDWDKACSLQINPKLKYFNCNETLRDKFYNNGWDIDMCERNSIFISQCSYPIKGFHIMLEAMPQILKSYPDTHIYTTGINPLTKKNLKQKLKTTYYQKYIGKLIKQLNLENNVTFLGDLNEEQMCNRFLKSHVFVLPSSIENSPNSLGEAMILGVPSIASSVGGVTSMMKHNEEGLIYQYDAPYMIAYNVCKIFSDDKLGLEFSNKSKLRAANTHNKQVNLNRIIDIYREVGAL